jgi:hypothetical protein
MMTLNDERGYSLRRIVSPASSTPDRSMFFLGSSDSPGLVPRAAEFTIEGGRFAKKSTGL